VNESGVREPLFVAPMTRAQKFQWHLEKGLAEGVWELPASMSHESVLDLVSALEQRLEILRTAIDSVGAELMQCIHIAGPAPTSIALPRGTTVERCQSALVSQFTENRHGRVGEFLTQFHHIHGEDGQWLTFVADNVAVDAGFHGVMDEMVAGILAGETRNQVDGLRILGGQRGIQPRIVAEMEAGPDWEAERVRARDYLRRHFATAPPRLYFARPSGAVGESRYFRSNLVMVDADAVLARIIEATGLLPSALILAAFTQLVCWRSDADACVVNVSMDNRHNSDLRRILCATAQRVPVALVDLNKTPLHATRGVQRALSSDYPSFGRYDPFDLLRERAEAEELRGCSLSADLAFNFIPPPQGWTTLVRLEANADFDLSSTSSTVRSAPTDETFYEYGMSLSVRWSDSHTARLSVHGDSDVIEPHQCEALLRGIELMMRRIASGGIGNADGIAHEVGLRKIEHMSQRLADTSMEQ
jgi:hypothetical protein